MRNKIETSSWKADLAAFGKRNYMRPTRLEVVGLDRNIESDFWLEDGLLLAGIDTEIYGDHGPYIEIMLQAPTDAPRSHMTHTVAAVKRVELETTAGRDEALEIEDKEGTVTIMRFESGVTSPDHSARK